MSKKFLDSGNDDPFDSGSMSIEDADAVLYGSVDIPDSGRVVARPIRIDEVWANPAQPRRAVPNSLQLYWNGNPADVPELLKQWHGVAGKLSGQTIDVYAVLQGQGTGFDLDDAPAVFAEYVALLRLAASIHSDGLINPITVIKQSDKYLIESGERRWLAHHLLNEYMGDYPKVPAVKSDGNNYIWRQATENTARRSLNAIGMARQLALLIMEARRDIDGQTYDTFDFMVQPGQCDRRFYAQVSNGNIHRVPRGFGEKIQGAMDLSMTQLSRYRNLLKLTDDDSVNDALWIRADVEEWAERAIRQVAGKPMDGVKAVIGRDDWSLDDLLAIEDPQSTLPMGKVETQSAYSVGEHVMLHSGAIGTVMAVSQSGKLTVSLRDEGYSLPNVDEGEVKRGLNEMEFKALKSNHPTPAPSAPVARPALIGKEVELQKTGERGIVVSEHGADLIKVKKQDGGSPLVSRDQVWVIASDKPDSVGLSEYYERPSSEPLVPESREFARVNQSPPAPVREKASSGFADVPASMMPDNTALISEHWQGMLRLVASMAAMQGKANVVGRVQRLSALTASKAETMDDEALVKFFEVLHQDMSSVLSDLLNEFGGLLDTTYERVSGGEDE